MANVTQQPRPRLLLGKRLAAYISSYRGVCPHRGAVDEIVKAMAAEPQPLCFEDRYFCNRMK
jgi:hypothetical protein